MLPKLTMKEINNQLSTINRVVIHPKYRTIGLSTKLIRETLQVVGTPYIELIAVMAKYSPFAEKAGMVKIAEQHGANNLSCVCTVLSDLEFDQQFLSSERYVTEKLSLLNPDQTSQLKQAFLKNSHPRFKREIAGSRHQPYGKTINYQNAVQKADTVKLTKLVKLVGMLAQTKVYLFWSAQKTIHS